ncbi:hypothetical protein DL96DRAFT_1608011 [Flagelloscypha sp. PMI_526]|nr:hypothetical protein DL96DRAFT_1608011 [Flagelloscypha sp. PMI_526]
MQLKPSPDLYFADGNIVLVASSTAFKVHKCQLARQSDMFSDLFHVASDTNNPGDEWFDGVAKVVLHDDSDDVAFFLKAIYDGLYFTPTASCFPALSSTLRLSSKYLVPHLQALCINRLVLDWPTTLSGWDQRENNSLDPNGKYNPREFTPHPVEVIKLVEEIGCDAFNIALLSQVVPSNSFYGATGSRILCTALYDLSRYGPSRILSSISNSPKSCAPPSPILARALQGRGSAQRFMANFIARELSGREPSLNCAYTAHKYPSAFTPQACRESFYFIMLNLLRSIGGIASGRDADPLFTLVQAVEMMERRDFSAGPGQSKTCGLKICGECKADFKACADRARKEVWENLPSWFGL